MFIPKNLSQNFSQLLFSTDTLLSRGDVAYLTGVSTSTVRDWELRDLIVPAKKNEAGDSLFSWFALRTALREAITRNLFAGLTAPHKIAPKRGARKL
jgi:hypothetical protein